MSRRPPPDASLETAWAPAGWPGTADESRGVRLGRRLLTLPLYGLAAGTALAGAPLWLAIAFAADRLRGGRSSLARCVAFCIAYLACEAVGILAAFAVWLARVARRLPADDPRYLAWNFRLQLAWAGALWTAGRRCFDLHLCVEGLDDGDAPVLLMPRHVSVGDTLLPAITLQCRHRMRLRYVLKRELLWDPCLDIVGNRLPNCFVRRGSGDTAREVEAVRALARDLGPREGLLIYPEGTRSTPAKRRRVIDRLRERGSHEAAAHAERLVHVLPPRTGGPLTLLDASPGLDVLFCAHTGFEGAARLSDLGNGALVGAPVRVRFWRVPREAVPHDPDARRLWLWEQWQRMDRTVGALRGAAGPTGATAS